MKAKELKEILDKIDDDVEIVGDLYQIWKFSDFDSFKKIISSSSFIVENGRDGKIVLNE